MLLMIAIGAIRKISNIVIRLCVVLLPKLLLAGGQLRLHKKNLKKDFKMGKIFNINSS